jgi:uncharacterized protein (DUF983 family)
MAKNTRTGRKEGGSVKKDLLNYMTFDERNVYLSMRRKAGYAVCLAVRAGDLPELINRLTREPKGVLCVDCKKGMAIHYEHRDYTRFLEVDPVCQSCNHRRGPALKTLESLKTYVEPTKTSMKCRRCGWEWFLKSFNKPPKFCPKCHCDYNTEPVKKRKDAA